MLTTMISNREHYINLSTRKRDGSFVNTPVWFAQEGETHNYYVYSLNLSRIIKRVNIVVIRFPFLSKPNRGIYRTAISLSGR